MHGSSKWLVLSGMACAVALGLLSVSELTGNAAGGADSAVLHGMLASRSPELTTLARAVTDSGTSPVNYPLVALTGLAVRLRTGRWAPGLIALGFVVTGVLARLGLSRLVADARPPRSDWLAGVGGYSFPSGHAATSALVAGALAWLSIQLVQRRGARRALVCGLALWALLVAVSRLYLGVHWISDVVGSWLLAGVWLAALFSLLPRTVPARSPGHQRPECGGGRRPERLGH